MARSLLSYLILVVFVIVYILIFVSYTLTNFYGNSMYITLARLVIFYYMFVILNTHTSFR